MKVTVKVDVRKDIARLKAAAGKDAPKVIKAFMLKHGRALISSSGNNPGLVQVTAPFQKGKQGSKAKASGENAISADLLGYGKSKQRTRGAFVVMDSGLLAKNHRVNKTGTVRLFVKKDGTVYGTDQKHFKPNASNAEMKAHHQSLRGANGRVTKAGGETRDIGRWKFINQMVVSRSAYLRYEKTVYKKVGMLASAMVASAERAFASKLAGVPAWVRRHPDRGEGKVTFTPTQSGFTITARNTSQRAIRDLQRRFDAVASYRLNAMKRDLPAAARALEKKLKADLASR